MSYQLLIVLLFLVCATRPALTARCERISIPFCTRLGYNQTIFPNNLDHESHEEAVADAMEFTSLVDSQCSRDIVYFLCSLYAPVCTMMGSALPPCRSLCKSARNGCEQLMNNYGFKWPDRFACNRFPRAREQLCVGRSTNSSEEESTKKTFKRSGSERVFRNFRRKACDMESSRAKFCCKLGRKTAKKGFNCNLRKKDKGETRKSIKFRKTVIRKCSKYSACFHSCCETRQNKRATKRAARRALKKSREVVQD